MKSNKRSTHSTVATRFDQKAGHKSDKKISEPASCKVCGAVYINNHWTFDKDVLRGDGFKKIEPAEVICPACLQIRNGVPSGFVYIKGEFFTRHREEIESLLKNEEKKLNKTNPLSRIMDFEIVDSGAVVTTTTEQLAQHFGRSLEKAYGGNVSYDFSRGNKLARVYWERDE